MDWIVLSPNSCMDDLSLNIPEYDYLEKKSLER